MHKTTIFYGSNTVPENSIENVLEIYFLFSKQKKENARVAELVDAKASKALILQNIRVQVSSFVYKVVYFAIIKNKEFLLLYCFISYADQKE